MSRIWLAIGTIRARFETLPPSEKFWVLFHLTIDLFLISFFCAAIYVGVALDPNTFYFWVPFLGFILWVRVKQAKARLKL